MRDTVEDGKDVNGGKVTEAASAGAVEGSVNLVVEQEFARLRPRGNVKRLEEEEAIDVAVDVDVDLPRSEKSESGLHAASRLWYCVELLRVKRLARHSAM